MHRKRKKLIANKAIFDALVKEASKPRLSFKPKKMSGTTQEIEPARAVFEKEALENFRSSFLKEKEKRILREMKDPYS